MKIKFLMCLSTFISITTFALCPKPTDITYNDNTSRWNNVPGWNIYGTPSYHQSPQVLGLHDALWNGFSGIFTCIYEVKLKSEAHMQVKLTSIERGLPQPSSGEWIGGAGQMICPPNPVPLSILDISNCPFSYT